MVEPLAHARAVIKELFDQINRLHISYLQADESPQKIEQRKKLENHIRQYLCLVAHGRKFRFPETAEILHHSVERKENFSGYRASTAWNAIARYAANLVAQPWRKEFRVIKTFSGFYMHDIEENLVGAELLLNHMGYRKVSYSVLVLEDPLDIDAVMEVSRDAIVAFVECQILKEIWEGVSHIECCWSEILDFRENHTGTPEDAIRILTYRSHQNRFRQPQLMSGGIPLDPYITTPHFHHHPTEPSCMYGQVPPSQTNLPCYGYQTYPSYTMPAQPRFANLVSPQQIMAPPGGYPLSPIGYQHAKTPIEMYPANGFHYSHPPQMIPGPAIHNGFIPTQPNTAIPSSYGCVVPTGQLIELDSSGPSIQPSQTALTACPQKPLPDDLQSLELKSGNSNDRTNDVYNECVPRRERPADLYASVHRSDPKCSRPNTLEDLKLRRNGTQSDHVASPSGEDSYARVDKHMGTRQSANVPRHHVKKGSTTAQTSSMQEGTGTYETWDYVYRNLESQGYSKDVGERGDILHSPASAGHRGSAGSGGSSHSVNDNYMLNSRNNREVELSVTNDIPLARPVSVLNSLQQLRLDNNGLSTSSGKGVDTVDSRGSIYDNASPKKISPHRDKTTGKMTSVSRTLPREARQESDKVLSATLNTRTVRSELKENTPIWECTTCTFHNVPGRDVCEMCGKSRQPGPEEKPLISGGRECPKCTLVNKRGVVSCEACNQSLKDSPTYI